MIRYKLIERERFGDAPFVGCLISAISCELNCKNCFNQHLKGSETMQILSEEIIQMVNSNPFEKGIILAGLEWSNQPDELIELVNLAKNNSLEIMIYTGLDENEFYKIVDKNKLPSDIYIKFGRYIESYKDVDNTQYGIKLASKNQYIKLI